MNKISQKDLQMLHKDLWLWLAETGESSKQLWPDWSEIFKKEAVLGNTELRIAMRNDCFACQEAYNRSDNSIRMCSHCPIKWRRKSPNHCNTKSTLYYKWRNTKHIFLRKYYARKIARLKWH